MRLPSEEMERRKMEMETVSDELVADDGGTVKPSTFYEY